jgi:hypothetical protein
MWTAFVDALKSIGITDAHNRVCARSAANVAAFDIYRLTSSGSMAIFAAIRRASSLGNTAGNTSWSAQNN